jgi:hypothetical protein
LHRILQPRNLQPGEFISGGTPEPMLGLSRDWNQRSKPSL